MVALLEKFQALRDRLADELFGLLIIARGSLSSVTETAFGTSCLCNRCWRAPTAKFRNGFWLLGPALWEAASLVAMYTDRQFWQPHPPPVALDALIAIC